MVANKWNIQRTWANQQAFFFVRTTSGYIVNVQVFRHFPRSFPADAVICPLIKYDTFTRRHHRPCTRRYI